MNVNAELQKQAIREYAFNYYLRKGIQLDVEKLFTRLLKQEEERPLTREELQDIAPTPGAYWEDISFVVHFYLAVGEPVTLQQIGHLEAVKRQAETNVYPRFKNQIANHIRHNKIRLGPYSNNFERAYDFGDISFMHGNATLNGRFEGVVKWEENIQIFSGTTYFEFSDIFSDPFRIIENLVGNSNDPDIPYLLRHLANLNGTPYPITGEWEVEFDEPVNAWVSS